MPEQFDSIDNPFASPTPMSGFSGEACAMLGATVRSHLATGGITEELARVTQRLCREAHARGLSADQTLAEIRETLGGILDANALTSTDRAALIALAIDECVHAFYREHQ